MREGLMQPPAGMAPPDAQSDTEDLAAEGGPDPFLGGDQEATPEEEQMYTKALDAMWGMLYANEETTNKVLTSLTQYGTEPETIGRAAGEIGTQIFNNVYEQVGEAGEMMSESTMLEFGLVIIEELLEIAETANVLPTDDNSLSAAVAGAEDVMMSKIGKKMADSGMINPQAGQAMLHQMRGLQQERYGEAPGEEMPPGGGGMPPGGGGMPPGGGGMPPGGGGMPPAGGV
jgi:hypothetical protein